MTRAEAFNEVMKIINSCPDDRFRLHLKNHTFAIMGKKSNVIHVFKFTPSERKVK